MKGTMSVSKATLKAFEESENVIYAPLFCGKVKQILGRPMCMDGTILRGIAQQGDAELYLLEYRSFDLSEVLTEKYKSRWGLNGKHVPTCTNLIK